MEQDIKGAGQVIFKRLDFAAAAYIMGKEMRTRKADQGNGRRVSNRLAAYRALR